MTRESIIELQRIDCNCNDCWFMVRNIELFKEWEEKNQLYAFTALELAIQKRLEKATEMERIGEFDKARGLTMEAKKLTVKNFLSRQLIQYGACHKFNKPVSFIPNVCQLETQNCFEHRRDEN
jgi:hypothetical protein